MCWEEAPVECLGPFFLYLGLMPSAFIICAESWGNAHQNLKLLQRELPFELVAAAEYRTIISRKGNPACGICGTKRLGTDPPAGPPNALPVQALIRSRNGELPQTRLWQLSGAGRRYFTRDCPLQRRDGAGSAAIYGNVRLLPPDAAARFGDGQRRTRPPARSRGTTRGMRPRR